MPLSALPGELFRLILIAAVQVRDVRRAKRLRQVSRLWSTAVLDAIFASGILYNNTGETALMRQYVAYMTLRPLGRLSRPLRIVLEVARRLAAHRSPAYTDEAVRDCVFEIFRGRFGECSISLVNIDGWNREPDSPIQRIEEEDDDFKQALLAAAALTNEVELARNLLPSFKNRLQLLYYSGKKRGPGVRCRPIFGHPLRLAAVGARGAIVRLIIETVDAGDPERIFLKDSFFEALLIWSVEGNDLALVELAVESRCDMHSTACFSLMGAPSVEIFKRLWPVARGFFRDEDHCRNEWLPRLLTSAARRGRVAIMEHLFELGTTITPPFRKYTDPRRSAAMCGHKDALACLLRRGFTLDQCVLEDAVWSGNREVVQFVLDHLDQPYSAAHSLLIAVGKENDDVTSMLMSLGSAHVDEEARNQAVQAMILASCEGQPRYVTPSESPVIRI